MNFNPINNEIHMYIADEEVVCDQEIQVTEKLLNTSSTVLYNCYPKSWDIEKDYTKFYFPKDYSKFELMINNQKVFRGVVKRSGAINLSPFAPHYAKLQVLDLKTFLSEGFQLNFVLKDVTIKQAIQEIINAYADYDFTMGNINIGNKENEIIKNYNCNEKTPYDCLSYIADLTQSVWKTRYVDTLVFGEKIAIDFYSYENLPNGQHILYDKKYCDDNSIISITHSFDSDDYRNVQVVTADEVESNLTIENDFIVSGTEESFELDEPVANIKSVVLAGNNLTFGVDSEAINYDLTYKYDSNVVKLNKTNIAGTILKIEYYPVVAGRQKMKNSVEINRIATQNDNLGEIARYEKRDEAYSSQELGKIAQSYLYFKGKPLIELEVKTLNNDMWNVGDTCYFDNNNIEALEDLNGSYIVKAKNTQIIQNNADNTANVFYTYTLINNFNFESAINFFDNQRAKRIGNINDGEFINRYIDFDKNVNIIFNGFTTENLVVEAQNELEAELEFNL